MFLDMLSEDEQRIFCQLAYAVMAADGEVLDKEEAFYDRALSELRLDELPAPGETNIGIPAGAFGVSANRRALLVELALLAVADGDVSAEERSVLASVASQVDMDGPQIDRCLDYAEKVREVLDEGLMLLAEGQ